jgi:hypothetical protein
MRDLVLTVMAMLQGSSAGDLEHESHLEAGKAKLGVDVAPRPVERDALEALQRRLRHAGREQRHTREGLGHGPTLADRLLSAKPPRGARAYPAVCYSYVPRREPA